MATLTVNKNFERLNFSSPNFCTWIMVKSKRNEELTSERFKDVVYIEKKKFSDSSQLFSQSLSSLRFKSVLFFYLSPSVEKNGQAPSSPVFMSPLFHQLYSFLSILTFSLFHCHTKRKVLQTDFPSPLKIDCHFRRPCN